MRILMKLAHVVPIDKKFLLVRKSHKPVDRREGRCEIDVEGVHDSLMQQEPFEALGFIYGLPERRPELDERRDHLHDTESRRMTDVLRR